VADLETGCSSKQVLTADRPHIGHVGRTGWNGVLRNDRQQATGETFLCELVSSQERGQYDAGKGIESKHVKISTRPVHRYSDWEQRVRVDMITRQHVVGPGFLPQLNTSEYRRSFGTRNSTYVALFC
jgi:hypothetical protein